MNDEKLMTKEELRDFIMSHNADDIDKYIMSFKKMNFCLTGEIMEFESAFKTLTDVGVKVDEASYGYEHHKLNRKRAEYELHEKLINAFLKEKRESCTHENTVEDSHDSHYTYYVCKDCGHMIRE